MNPTQSSKASRSSRITAVLGLVLCVLLGSLLLCNLIIIVKGALQPDRPPSLLGVTPLVVLSGSMSGTQEGHIETGDLVFVRSAEPETLQEGDVIAFLSGGVTVTHRITAIGTAEDGSLLFTTKGDANDTEDTDAVTAEQLVGIYQGRIPKVGDFVLFLQRPLGMLLFIGVPLLSFILYDIFRRQRNARFEKEKAQEMEAELARLRSLTEERETSSVGADSHS